MITIKAKPKTIFGIILAVTGIAVILLTFIGNHTGSAPAAAQIKCSTAQDRISYITSLGWQLEEGEEKKSIVIPSAFNDVYNDYNDIQKSQGFDLENYKGKRAVLYSYRIKNYKGSDNVKADLIVYNGNLIGADLCDSDAQDGFLIALQKNEDGQT